MKHSFGSTDQMKNAVRSYNYEEPVNNENNSSPSSRRTWPHPPPLLRFRFLHVRCLLLRETFFERRPRCHFFADDVVVLEWKLIRIWCINARGCSYLRDCWTIFANVMNGRMDGSKKKCITYRMCFFSDVGFLIVIFGHSTWECKYDLAS